MLSEKSSLLLFYTQSTLLKLLVFLLENPTPSFQVLDSAFLGISAALMYRHPFTKTQLLEQSRYSRYPLQAMQYDIPYSPHSNIRTIEQFLLSSEQGFSMRLSPYIVSALLTGFIFSNASAHVNVEGAWIRATVEGQNSTGAFMKIKSSSDAQLSAIQTPVAGLAQVHEMKMENNIMKMRAIPTMHLPAHQTISLTPGNGYHIMLMDLKRPLREGEIIPIQLRIQQTANPKKTTAVTIQAVVKNNRD